MKNDRLSKQRTKDRSGAKGVRGIQSIQCQSYRTSGYSCSTFVIIRGEGKIIVSIIKTNKQEPKGLECRGTHKSAEQNKQMVRQKRLRNDRRRKAAKRLGAVQNNARQNNRRTKTKGGELQ